ncbi:MAG: hypothetical protein ACYC2H_01955 [Thermoplasmatota archaeon]
MSPTKKNTQTQSKNLKSTKTQSLRFDTSLHVASLKTAILVLTGLDLSALETNKAYVLSDRAGAYALVLQDADGPTCLECPHSMDCTHICAVTLFERRIQDLQEEAL